MLARGPKSEPIRRTSFRRGFRVAAISTVFCFIAVTFAIAQPPSDSLASKYPPGKTEEAKPAKSTEPDPTANCPWLDDIFDDRPMPTSAENREEYLAFNYFVGLARGYSSDVLAKHADERLTWRVLIDRDRAKYRGKIVHVEGVLKRLTWIGSNKGLESSGVKDLYEAWIENDRYPYNPTCVVISELLPGQKAGENIVGQHASCEGYFFKRYQYRALNNEYLRAPLVIGHNIAVTEVRATPDAGAEAFGRLFLPTVCILVLGMVAAAVVMHRWFTKSDQRIHRRLLSARFGDEFIAPIEGPASFSPHETDEATPYNDGTL